MIGVIITGVAFNFVILVFAEIKLVHHLYTKFKLKANQKIKMIQAHNEEKKRQKYNLKLNKMFNGKHPNPGGQWPQIDNAAAILPHVLTKVDHDYEEDALAALQAVPPPSPEPVDEEYEQEDAVAR